MWTELGDCSTFYGDLTLNGIPKDDLTGLDYLETVTGSLRIIHTGTLNLESGLTLLTSVGGHLEISSNLGLHSLTGIAESAAALTIGGTLTVSDNPNLTDIGLTNLETGGASAIVITDNTSLCQFDAESICYYVGLEPSTQTLSGNNDCLGAP